jgi:hypothetical protein
VEILDAVLKDDGAAGQRLGERRVYEELRRRLVINRLKWRSADHVPDALSEGAGGERRCG